MNSLKKKPFVGVGLRHKHFKQALDGSSSIDFIELHSENFFVQGGAKRKLIDELKDIYPISLHSTAMGLGSAETIGNQYFSNLLELIKFVDPILVSDHASFSWASIKDQKVHAGDLLPIAYNEKNLKIMSENVDFIQQNIGREILLENLSSYTTIPGSTMSEAEFLCELTHRSQCSLLLDLNNILVNMHNFSHKEPISEAIKWLSCIPKEKVKEIHLAGFTPVVLGEMAIDDHSKKVSDDCWQLYRHTISEFGSIPTLIEWDNDIPEWSVLLKEVDKARKIIIEEIFHE